MTETTTLRTLLLPELQSEFSKTRRMLDALPNECPDYKPHEKSFSFARLAGHTAEMPRFLSITLTSPDLDFGSAPMPERLLYQSRQQIVAAFDELADHTVSDLKNASDELFRQTWHLQFKGHTIFRGDRYTAYREMGLNHMVHHRGQLGMYLRLNHLPVPGLYGPSADEPF